MRTFQHALSIVLTGKGEVAIERDDDGQLDASQGPEILELLEKFAKEEKTGVSTWAYYCPVLDKEGNPVFETEASGKLKLSARGKPIAKTAPFADKKAREGRTAHVLANSFGKPYVAMLPPQGVKQASKSGKRKLA